MEWDEPKESYFPRRTGQLLVQDLRGWLRGFRRPGEEGTGGRHSLLAGHCVHHSPAVPGQPQPATMPAGLRCPLLMPAWELGGGQWREAVRTCWVPHLPTFCLCLSQCTWYSYKDSTKQLIQQHPALGQEPKLWAGGLESGFTYGV